MVHGPLFFFSTIDKDFFLLHSIDSNSHYAIHFSLFIALL